MKHAERAFEDGADRAGKIVCMWTREQETNLTKQKEGDRERKREEEVRSVRKMETCNIRGRRRDNMFDERAGKTWTRGEGSHGLRD